MAISVVLLARKEEQNLKKMLPLLHTVLKKTKEEYEIIVIDSQEPLDNTKEVCQKNKVLYFNQKEKGYANAFKDGIKKAKYEKIQVLDCDFSHDPNVIVDINKKFNEGYDLVIGSRYTKGGKTNDSKVSQLMSKTLNFIYRLFLGIKAKDISTSFRMYDAKQLKKVDLECVNFDVLEEVIFKMMQNNNKFKIGEVPIYFDKRLYGESNRRLIPFIKSYIKTLFKLIKIRIKTNDNFRNAFLYLIIGGCAAILDFGSFFILNNLLHLFNKFTVNIISMHIGLVFSFTFNSIINFKKTDKLLIRFLSYYLIVLIGMAISTGIIFLFGKYELLGKFVALIIVTIIQFFLNKLITFRKLGGKK